MKLPTDDTVLEDVEMTSLVGRGSHISRRNHRENDRMILQSIMSLFDRIGRARIQIILILLMVFVFVVSFNSSSNNSNSSDNLEIHQPVSQNPPPIPPSSNRHEPPPSAPKSIPTHPTHAPTINPTVLPEGQTRAPISQQDKIQAEIKQWGKWHFWDNVDPALRPALSSYVSLYPNGDVPYKKFPPKAWQGDAVFVNHFLDSAVELIQRAKDVIFTEYGWGPKKSLSREQVSQRNRFFKFHRIDFNSTSSTTPQDNNNKNDDESIHLKLLPQGWERQGGWTTERTFLSLSKRLLHCMMTNCEFTIVVGGGHYDTMNQKSKKHHGNHITQSFIHQFQHLMNPIFQRLGMNLTCRNMISTSSPVLHYALGFTSIYGSEIDMFLWEQDEEEDAELSPPPPELDLLYRQAILSTRKAPILVGGSFTLLRLLYLHADADVMALGNASSIWKITESYEQAQQHLPWSMRLVKCTEESLSICEDPKNKYRTLCDDHVSNDKPGFREHRLKARVLAFAILDALEDALASWSSATIMGMY